MSEVKVDGCTICKTVVEALQSLLLSNTTEVLVFTCTLPSIVPLEQYDCVPYLCDISMCPPPIYMYVVR